MKGKLNYNYYILKSSYSALWHDLSDVKQKNC